MVYQGRIAGIGDWLAGLLGGICLLCHGPADRAQELCPACRAGLPWLGPACRRCAAPVALPGTTPCGRCQQHPPAFSRSMAVFAYRPPLDRWIPALKYHNALHLARTLGRELAACSLRHPPDPPVDVLMPVPLHRGRLRERGYNQSLELARPAARALGVALDYRSLQRVRPTRPQTGLDTTARRRNVRDAFALALGAAARVQGRRIALIDDVMTTGYTAEAAARSLLAAGAAAVELWAIARA